MKVLTLLIASILLMALPCFLTSCSGPKKAVVKTYWQVEELIGNDIYYIRWEVVANVDSLQFIYFCGNDTTYSEVKRSSDKNFIDTHQSQCEQQTKVVINPFVKNQQHFEYIDIPLIKSLPDTI